MNLSEYYEQIKIDLKRPRTKAYQIMREHFKGVGHWKNKARGVPIVTNLKRQFTVASMSLPKPQQVSVDDPDYFTEL